MHKFKWDELHVSVAMIRTRKRIFGSSGEFEDSASRGAGGVGVLHYMGYIGMCGPKGYGFPAVLVIKGCHK